MAQNSERVFILVIVAVFLLSTLAFTGIVIYSIIGDNGEAETELTQAQIDELTQQDSENQLDGEENMLAGTQLQGFEPIANAVAELQIEDVVEGDGSEVKAGDTIVAHYTGAYAVNGEIFESSIDGGEPATFPLGDLIPGWQQGIPGMKEGGTRRLVIPGDLAYGVAPEGYSPGDGGRPLGTLVFDIQLFSIAQ